MVWCSIGMKGKGGRRTMAETWPAFDILSCTGSSPWYRTASSFILSSFTARTSHENAA